MPKLRIALVLAAAMVVTAGLAGPVNAGGRTFTVDLSGANEPSNGDPDGSGTATITLNAGKGEVCWTEDVSDIVLPALASHIHIGPAGINGPIVVTLSPPDATGHSEGCTSADKALIHSMLVSPQVYYVNVHTSTNPGGAVRGQLKG